MQGLAAQIICVVDVYDALTTARSYRAPLRREDALREMQKCRQWWKPEVYQAFERALAGNG